MHTHTRTHTHTHTHTHMHTNTFIPTYIQKHMYICTDEHRHCSTRHHRVEPESQQSSVQHIDTGNSCGPSHSLATAHCVTPAADSSCPLWTHRFPRYNDTAVTIALPFCERGVVVVVVVVVSLHQECTCFWTGKCSGKGW